MAYGLILLVIYLFAAFFIGTPKLKTPETRTKFFYFFSFTVLVLLSGLRDINVGLDTHAYYNGFYDIQKLEYANLFDNSLHFEPGWILLNKLVSVLGGNYFVLQIIVSAVIGYSFMTFTSENVSHPFLAVIVFLSTQIFLQSLNIQRQMFAGAIALTSYRFIKENKWLPFLLIVALATSFHKTAVIFLVIPCVLWLLKRKNGALICLTLFVLLYVFFETLLALVAPFLVKELDYVTYFTTQDHQVEIGGIVLLWAVELAMAFVVLIKSEKDDAQKKSVPIFTILYIILTILGTRFPFFERFGLYFIPFVILLFDSFCNVLKGRQLRIIYNAVMIVLLSIFFLMSSSAEQYNYSFFF